MKPIHIALLAFLLACAPVLADRWVSEDGTVSLEFRPDGTFVSVVQGNHVEGRYGEQDGVLVLVAPDGTTLSYRVNRVDESTVVLVDAQGAAWRFVRVREEAADPVLVRAGGRELRASHFEVGCTLAALLVDRPLTEVERDRLLAATKRDFPADPAEFLRQMDEVRRSLEPILSTGDPLTVARLQQALVVEFHLATRAMPAETRPEVVRLMDENVRVLAVDEANRVLLNDRVVDAFLALADLGARTAGQPPLSEAVDRAELERALAEAFRGMSGDERRGLASLPVVWRVIEHNWDRAGEAERARLAAALGLGTARNDPPPAEAEGSDSAASRLLEMQADAWHRQQMFDIMNRMSLDSHATSLNIIENMGGTGNYWEVVDQP